MILDEAREAVLRDLDGRHVELVDQAVEQRRWWLSQWEDGAPFILCLLAQDVQENVHEVDPMWPPCDEHEDHCLLVEPDLGTDPFWVCPRSGLPIAAVGSLLKLG
ncbi:MAG: hypothetical protein JWN31_1280 [Frankiales bacterium]|nr:hypothetical protein [Frankiales bacterium]